MNHIERRDAGLPYLCTDEVFEQQKHARRLTQKLNQTDRSDFKALQKIAVELLGKSDDPFINPPFYCDYGFNIEVGSHFFANYNCTILDICKVKIGNRVMLAPNVAIYTAGHPIDPMVRATYYEFGQPVTIGDYVWIGGNTVICPGVTIGDNTVIGAGSVVTKDIPANVVAAGNPCRVIREITEEDKYVYFRGKRFDEPAWQEVETLIQKVKEEDGIE